MASDEISNKILRYFPTEKTKRFNIQTRPLITIASGVLLAVLGWFHIIPQAVACWVAATFVLDNVALTPIITALKAQNNLQNERKQFKAKVMLAVIALTLLAGTLLGYFVLAQTPMVMKLLFDYIALTGCSPLLISIGSMIGAYISHATHKIPLFWAIFAGSCLASMVALPVPLILEMVYFSAVATAFLATIITKQTLRVYFKKRYGDSNADGYGTMRSKTDQDAFIAGQAKKLGVSPQEFTAITTLCRERIAEQRKKSNPWTRFMLYEVHITNSYKDILLHMMGKLSSQEVEITKDLIAQTRFPYSVTNTKGNCEQVTLALRKGTFFKPDFEERMLVHRVKIADGGGIDPDTSKPFNKETEIDAFPFWSPEYSGRQLRAGSTRRISYSPKHFLLTDETSASPQVIKDGSAKDDKGKFLVPWL
ncbi:MAG: hypothetical protein NXI01_04625 [Gammaproteobacteria bacterium]|nr:hypothetical protein [Gammaproteobacteria bacterium]